MIKAHQPTIFGSNVTALISSVDDGNMKLGIGNDEEVQENRRKFLSRHMIAMQTTVLCGVTYDRTDFTQYAKVTGKDKGRGMLPGTEAIVADALATDEKGIALFLPLADCIGAVFYDPARAQPRLMVAHLGRHSLEQDGATECVKFMQFTYGTKPEDLLVWVSPAPNRDDYPLWKRDNKSMHEVVFADLVAAGVSDGNIEICRVDTITSEDYFSHSEFLKGNREADGRYAIVAKLR